MQQACKAVRSWSMLSANRVRSLLHGEYLASVDAAPAPMQRTPYQCTGHHAATFSGTTAIISGRLFTTGLPVYFSTMASSSGPSIVSLSNKESTTASRSDRLSERASLASEYASSTSLASSSSIVDSVSSEAAVEENMPGFSAGSHAIDDNESEEKPHCATIRRAMFRTCCKSLDAPVVTSSAPYTNSSATRPPNATANWPLRNFSEYKPDSLRDSSGVNNVNPPAPFERGMIVSFATVS